MNWKLNGKSLLLAAGMFLVVVECRGDDDTIITNIFGGSENVAIVANADTVQAWRTLGSVRAEKPGYVGVPNDYPNYYRKTGRPVLVSSDLAAELSRLILDKNSYLTCPMKNCRPDAEVAVTFSHANKSVDIYLCFNCNVLVVNGIPLPNYIDPGSEAILQVIKKVFPNDRKIRSLE
jgi:hypothetical protein